MPEDAVMDEIEAPVSDEVEEAPIDATELGDEEVVEEPSEEESTGEEDEEEPVEGQPEEKAIDGRKMPDNVKKGIAALKASNPEAARVLKETYWSEQKYREVYETPQKAAEAKAQFEQLGGSDGLQQLQSEREEFQKLDQSYAEASPEFAKTIAANNPEAFQKIAPHVLNEWANRNPEDYGYYTNAVTLNTLASAGITTGQLKQAFDSYAGKPEVQGVLADIYNALLPIEQKRAEYQQKRTDPREEALKQKETQFEQRRRADFEGGVAGQAEKYLSEKMAPALAQIIGARNVDPDAKKGFESMVNAEVMRMLGETPNFAANLEAHYRTGDSAKSLGYITAQYNRILPLAAKVIEPYLRNIGSTTKKPSAGAVTGKTAKPAGVGEVSLKEMPDWDQVNWDKTTTQDMILGKAVLTNGKKASGWA